MIITCSYCREDGHNKVGCGLKKIGLIPELNVRRRPRAIPDDEVTLQPQTEQEHDDLQDQQPQSQQPQDQQPQSQEPQTQQPQEHAEGVHMMASQNLYGLVMLERLQQQRPAP